jgi:hypothetical protein
MKPRTRGLAVVENTIDIARSPEDVFDYCVDLTREPEWNPKARRVEQVTAGPVGLGTRYEAEFLKGSPTTIEVVRFERPVAWETVGRSRRLDAKMEGRVLATEDGAHRHADGVEAEGNAQVVAADHGSLHAQTRRTQSRGDQGGVGRLRRKRRSARRVIASRGRSLDANDQGGRIRVPGQ